MNSVFNINRFLQLEKRNFFLSKMQYIYILAGLAGLYLISMLLFIIGDITLKVFIALFFIMVIVAGPTLFEVARNRHTSILDFTLPASSFEKFLIIWFKYVIILPVTMIALLFLLNTISGIMPVEEVRMHAEKLSRVGIFNSNNLCKLIVWQSVFMVGYYYFRKYAFVKSSLVVICFLIMVIVVSIAIFAYAFESGKIDLNINGNGFLIGYNMGYDESPNAIEANPLFKYCTLFLNIVTALGMWTVCYFKQRETEI